MKTCKILIVDDEEDILDLIRYNLEKEGYLVIQAMNGDECLKMVDTRSPDLLILDLMMPGMDGLEVCRKLKANPLTKPLPIIMLTAKTEEADVVLGLELGADDYIAKPFSPRELVARVRSALRRASASAGDKIDATEVLNRSGCVLNLAGRSALYNGKQIDFTFTEFEILKLMISHPGRVFSRTQIMKAAREDEYISTERAIDVQILNIRKKLGDGAALIKTVRGAGYKFDG